MDQPRRPSSKKPPPPAMTPRPMRAMSRPAERTKNPRRVRGGVRMPSTQRASESWAGQRWLRLIEQGVEPAMQAEAMEYAALGQTRTMGVEPGQIVASVQGRSPRAYRVSITLPAFTDADWERVLATMGDQARYAAKLLAGELPTSIEELFVPLGLHLYPTDPAELVPTCNCDEPKSDPGGWCKHSVCAALLMADQLAQDPWLIFTLRGMPKTDLLDRLRHGRLVPGGADGSAPVYAPHVGPVEAIAVQPLESCIEHFWEQPATLEHLHLAVEKPEVTHPLLRRLGQSPFEQSRFPLVGLLATCYDLISEHVLRTEPEADHADAEDEPAEAHDAESESDA